MKMRKKARPFSCRLQRPNRYCSTTLDPQNKPIQTPLRPTDSYQIKISLIHRDEALDARPVPNDSDTSITDTPSKSKFLQKFNNIRSSRESLDMGISPNAEQERRRKVDFQINKKKLFMSTKILHGNTPKSIAVSEPFPQDKIPVVSNALRAPLNERRRSRPASLSIQFIEMRKISKKQLILMKSQGQGKLIGEQGLTCFWKNENRFVSLIPLARSQKVSFEHSNILPIYAEVSLNGKRYVVSDEYKNCSLKHLLEEFGPFREELAKRYLKQIALGLQHMHFHRRGHNRLSPTAILYNKNGELFINAVRSTSFVLSKEESANCKDLHYFAPEFLLSKGYSKSLKNDIWAVGCLAIIMLTSNSLQLSPLHPYNFQQKDNAEQQMIENMKQLHKEYFSQKFQQPKGAKPGREVLSEAANNFIQKCMKPLSDDRQSIETLLDHQFLQGV